MTNASARKVGALCRKDLVDLFKNPSMLVALVFPVGFAALMRFLAGGSGAQGPSESQVAELMSEMAPYLLSSSLCMSIGMVVGMVVVYGIAEEKEKHTLRTLMLANVSAGQILASRAAVALGASLAVAVACFFVGGAADVSLLPGYVALCVLGALPLALVALVLGLASRDQMTAGLYSIPVVLVAMVPMFGQYSDGIADVVRWLPTGGMDELVGLMVAGRLLTADALAPLATTLAWIVAAAVAFALLWRRLVRDN